MSCYGNLKDFQMKHILLVLIFVFLPLKSLSAVELLKNGDFETGNIMGWTYWETYPWDGDGFPVERPTHVAIVIPGDIGVPAPPAISGFFALAQEVVSHGTARGGLYQEVKVMKNVPYILTGYTAFYGDDTGDLATIGILDGAWDPAQAFMSINKGCFSGNVASSWIDISLTIMPTKDIVTVFTETRQDWPHGSAAGWYDSLSLRPFSDSVRFPPSREKSTSVGDERQKQTTEKD